MKFLHIYGNQIWQNSKPLLQIAGPENIQHSTNMAYTVGYKYANSQISIKEFQIKILTFWNMHEKEHEQ